MIPTFKEISDGMTGAWRLAVRDPDALQSFDVSADGFWKSFSAVILGLPLWFWLVLSSRDYLSQLSVLTGGPSISPDFVPYLAGQAISYLLGWILFPVIMIYVARALGVSARLVSFVIARNWALFLSLFLLSVPPSALFNLGLIGAEGKTVLDLVATVLGLVYLWQVTVTALAVSGVLAVGLVSLDLLLTLVIVDLSTRLYLT